MLVSIIFFGSAFALLIFGYLVIRKWLNNFSDE